MPFGFVKKVLQAIGHVLGKGQQPGPPLPTNPMDDTTPAPSLPGPASPAGPGGSSPKPAGPTAHATLGAVGAAVAVGGLSSSNPYAIGVGTAMIVGGVLLESQSGSGNGSAPAATPTPEPGTAPPADPARDPASATVGPTPLPAAHNAAGIRLLQAAQAYRGEPYNLNPELGTSCDVLVWKAARDAGLRLDRRVSKDGKTVTGTWFREGMGDDFEQVLGGVDGITLQELVEGVDAATLPIPIGAVLVADGHAALFNGVVKVNGHWQLILFDANSQPSWSLTFQGVPVKGDQTGRPDIQIVFPGKQVGEHVTRLHWGLDKRVKVFQPRTPL